jgi:4-alpha-glucanotransferase
MSRTAGINVPLFSCRSTRSWGIGELVDLGPLARWLGRARVAELMLLPLGAMPDGEASPYSARSTLGIDPIYVAMSEVPDFARAGGPAALSAEARAALDRARRSPVVRHDDVRRAKHEAFALAFRQFVADEWEQLTPRAAALAGYIARERWWLDDYALYAALVTFTGAQSWREWPPDIRRRDPRALDDARRELAREVLRHQYQQWIAEGQWHEARAAARAQGVRLVGDLPFVPRDDSPEVWARDHEYLEDVSAGVPPDAFSATGQDWGLPTYNWPEIAATGYAWFAKRAERMAALYDSVRVDHVVGLYRTYGRPRAGPAFFTPADEPSQRAQGEAVLAILRGAGLDLIAEDLGSIPDFVRASLSACGIPGCRVLRWERQWHSPGQPFLDPSSYPRVSAAMTGTHDTEPLAAWWNGLADEDRAAFVSLPLFTERRLDDARQPWSDRLRDVILEQAYRAGSDRLFLPIQDAFGWPDRINTPATVAPQNWTWCLPWPVDEMDSIEMAVERSHVLAALAAATGRTDPPDYTRARPDHPGAPA